MYCFSPANLPNANFPQNLSHRMFYSHTLTLTIRFLSKWSSFKILWAKSPLRLTSFLVSITFLPHFVSTYFNVFPLNTRLICLQKSVQQALVLSSMGIMDIVNPTQLLTFLAIWCSKLYIFEMTGMTIFSIPVLPICYMRPRIAHVQRTYLQKYSCIEVFHSLLHLSSDCSVSYNQSYS